MDFPLGRAVVNMEFMFSKDYGIHTLKNTPRQHSLSNMSSGRFRPASKRKCTSGGAFNHFVGANGTERNEDAAKGRSVEDRALARDSRLCLRFYTSNHIHIFTPTEHV